MSNVENKKYILLQAPKPDDYYIGQIVIIDNSTHIGKKRVELLIAEGYESVGFVESELTSAELKDGFNSDLKRELDKKREVIKQAFKLWLEV